MNGQVHANPRLAEFAATLQFELDDFQRAGCAALEARHSVLVAAPTGAGKTVVAEFAVFLAMQEPTAKVLYTTPIKALSNQKYQELAEIWGTANVGLLTGDTNLNSSARIVVMTTEVLRNMLYADSPMLKDLAFVVMDEVHYLADRFRGAVWEEVIIHLPDSVRLVSLSATVSNAEEFGAWLQTVRGETEVIVSENRPVPLEQHVLLNGNLLELFDSPAADSVNGNRDSVNPELLRLSRLGGRSIADRSARGRRGRDRGYFHRPRAQRPDRVATASLLATQQLLPAIVFIFSRAGCDQAVWQLTRGGLQLTTPQEREQIRRVVEARVRTLRNEDLTVLGYWEWLSALEKGIAAHHAGLLPAFKEVVEELFQRKLLKVVFATETLALGVNMPARSVVLEKLEKFNGESRVPITPGEYTQLTGRAGRRGIDVEGHAVIQWRDNLDPEAVAALASRRSYPLNSSFRPTYNMAVNLIDQFGRARTRQILELSFAQFQADRAVVSLVRTLRSQEESLAGYQKAMACHLGNFADYASLRREISDLEREHSKRNSGMSHAQRERNQHEIATLRKKLRAHPCHGCAERESHARWAERWVRLKRSGDQLKQQIDSRTGEVAKLFDRVTEVLMRLGYLEEKPAVAPTPVPPEPAVLPAHAPTEPATSPAKPTAPPATEPDISELTTSNPGRRLKRIYGERDLLVAECLRRDIWIELDPPALAAMSVCLVYEPRRDDSGVEYRLPGGPFRASFEATVAAWSQLDDIEQAHQLPGSAPPNALLANAMRNWAAGAPLGAILDETALAAGDFVRITKQVIDLLDQISQVADPKLARTARKALDGVRRGVLVDAFIG